MKLLVASPDPRLLQLCREAAAEVEGVDWEVWADHGAGTDTMKADLHVWELSSDGDPAARFASAAAQVVIVEKDDHSALKGRLDRPNIGFLLKPATRAKLAAFLQAAADVSRADRTSEPAGIEWLARVNLELQGDRVPTLVAMAVHDLRAPLTAINGYCGLLASGSAGDVSAKQNDLLMRMQRSSSRLLRLVESMLHLSIDGEAGTAPQIQRGDLGAAIEQAVHEVLPTVEQRRVKVSVEVLPGAEECFIDRTQMERVLVNLLENAAKFTSDAGEIAVRGYGWFRERRKRELVWNALERRRRDSSEPNGYRVDVENSGPAIPRQDVDWIFEERTSKASRNGAGSGLGLAICKRIMAGHEGMIWAENSGRGPVFSVFLPFRREKDPV